MIKRIFVLSLCIAALVLTLVLPASAAGIDYNDLNPSVTVDGDKDIVVVSIPSQYFSIEVVEKNLNTSIAAGNDSVRVGLVADFNYDIHFEIFSDFGHLDVSNIPNGTVVKYDIDIATSNSYNTPYLYSIWSYFSETDFVGSSTASVDVSPIESMTLIDVINKPVGATQAAHYFMFENFIPLSSGSFVFRFYSCTLTMSISSLYRLQQQTGKTNEILSAVEKQLEEQGKTLDEVLQQQQQTNDQLGDLNDKQDQTNDKLDDIINGTVDPSAPAGSDSVGDLDDAEGGLRDDAQTGLDQGLAVQQSALAIVLQYASAFACVGWIFNKFANLPFFSGLLYVSLALGIYGAILGAGMYLARSGTRSAGRSVKRKGG